ncbi:MAG TPA: SPOR domain-containing protein [Gemmatimonadaceae bacterium]
MSLVSIRTALLAIAVALTAPASADAQTPARPMTPADSVFTRAQQLVRNGNGAAGRLLVDSMVTVTSPDSASYAEALYWRATLAASGGDAEQDYRRIIVEYALSPHAGDALLQLARLEATRGDRAAATTHLERFLLENPRHPERARTGLQLVKLEFDQNETQRGCIVLARTMRDVTDADVELRNQLSFYSPRCAGVDTTRRVATTDSASTKRDSTSASKAAKGRFTLQITAVTTKAEADRLASRLKARGIDARVVGTAKPFRVRVGRYETRAAATTAAGKLKAQKIDAIVVQIGGEER